MNTVQLRHQLRNIAPGFLKRGERGQALLFSLGLVLDGLAEWALQGVLARFPYKAPPTALPALGRDRRIVKGFDETNGAYRVRLVKWLDSWRKAGHAYSVLEQLAGVLAPHEVRIRIVTNTGLWYERDSDGTLSWSRGDSNAWNWDDAPELWSRFWVIIYPLDDVWEPEDVWGVGTWGDGGTWGTTAELSQVAAVRSLIRTWKPAHARCEWIVIAFDDATFDPSDDSTYPIDGTWGPWGEVGTDPRTPSRYASARYWDGT